MLFALIFMCCSHFNEIVCTTFTVLCVVCKHIYLDGLLIESIPLLWDEEGERESMFSTSCRICRHSTPIYKIFRYLFDNRLTIAFLRFNFCTSILVFSHQIDFSWNCNIFAPGFCVCRFFLYLCVFLDCSHCLRYVKLTLSTLYDIHIRTKCANLSMLIFSQPNVGDFILSSDNKWLIRVQLCIK